MSASQAHWEKVVAATWGHLEECYTLSDDDTCISKIFVWSRGDTHDLTGRPFNISELKRVCAAIVHFEEIFRMAMDDADDGSSCSPDDTGRIAMRNWRDNPRFEGLTKSQSIARIEAIEPIPDNIKRLVDFIEEGLVGTYSWGLHEVLPTYGRGPERPIKYWQFRGCTKAIDAIKRIELVATFVRAAIACPPESLRSRKNVPNYQCLAHFLRRAEHGPDERIAHGASSSEDSACARSSSWTTSSLGSSSRTSDSSGVSSSGGSSPGRSLSGAALSEPLRTR